MSEKRGWFGRLTEGLSRSSMQMAESVVAIVARKPLDQARLDALEEMLIEADLGPAAAASVTAAFAKARFGKESSEDEVREALAEALAAELISRQGVFDPLSGPRPYVVLFIGVNGSGKTTTLGKIAADLTRRGAKVLIAAGDTFRAAAVEQLGPTRTCACKDALATAIITRPDHVPESVKQELAPIIGKYVR